MHRATLAVLILALGCQSPAYKKYLEHQEQFADSGDSSGEPEATTSGDSPTSSGAIGSDGTDASAGTTDATDTALPADTGEATDTGDTTDTEDNASLGDSDKPAIVWIDLPDNVHAAGPVPIEVHTRNTGSVHATLNGADAGPLITAGDGIFTGTLPVHGAIDNGWHAVEVIARQGPHEDRHDDGYTVEAPEPGTGAWSQSGPEGSRTNRVAVTLEGDLIEVGQTEIGGAPRPTIRKRSGLTGAELWPEETITLDLREGAAVDVAVLPDGRMWVAMNVRPQGKDSLPRIALLGADGHALGIEVEGTPGHVVRALAADANGGCFAVGLAGVMGDWDIAYWRIDAAGVQTLGDTFDYNPDPDTYLDHSFLDLANDVVIAGNVAWVVGVSKGEHDANVFNPYLRGVLVPMNVHTAALAGPVIVAPLEEGWPNSAFLGAALYLEGVVVSGYRCDQSCSKYQIQTSRYGFDGVRTWSPHGDTIDGLAHGSDVAVDSQGRALVAGAVTQNGELRGYVFGRTIGVGLPVLFEHWYPGVGPSEGLGIVSDAYDRIFAAGYITVNGETQARLTRIHG